ncbi:MAG: OadG family protein [Eubacteriales bacterium]
MTLNAVLLATTFSIENLQDPNTEMWIKGLFVVIIGLIGVFLVLSLFFLTIVLMQKISDGFTRIKPKKES